MGLRTRLGTVITLVLDALVNLLTVHRHFLWCIYANSYLISLNTQHGDDDFLAVWKARLPHAERHEFEDAGHYVLEDAHERILPLVRDFLAKHPLSAQAASA